MLLVAINFIQEHAAEAWAIWGAIITIASLIIRLTPTKKDDKAWAMVYKVLNALALNPPDKRAETLTKDR